MKFTTKIITGLKAIKIFPAQVGSEGQGTLASVVAKPNVKQFEFHYCFVKSLSALYEEFTFDWPYEKQLAHMRKMLYKAFNMDGAEIASIEPFWELDDKSITYQSFVWLVYLERLTYLHQCFRGFDHREFSQQIVDSDDIVPLESHKTFQSYRSFLEYNGNQYDKSTQLAFKNKMLQTSSNPEFIPHLFIWCCERCDMRDLDLSSQIRYRCAEINTLVCKALQGEEVQFPIYRNLPPPDKIVLNHEFQGLTSQLIQRVALPLLEWIFSSVPAPGDQQPQMGEDELPSPNKNSKRFKKYVKVEKVNKIKKQKKQTKKEASSEKRIEFEPQMQLGIPLTHSLDETTQQNLESILELLKPVSEIANRLNVKELPTDCRGDTSELVNLTQSLGKAFGDGAISSLTEFLSQYGKETMSFLISAVMLYSFSTGDLSSTKTRTILISGGMILTILNASQMTHLSTVFMTAYASLKDQVQPQSGEMDPDMISNIVLASITAWTGFTLPKKITKVEAFKRMVSNFYSTKRDVFEFIKWILACSQELMDYVCTECIGIKPYSFVYSDSPKVEDWVDRVREVILCDKQGRLPLDIPTAEMLWRLEMEGHGLMASIASKDVYRNLRDRLIPLILAVQKLQLQYVKADLYSRGSRMEPLTLCIRGASGIGKSRLLQPMTYELCGALVSDSELEQFTNNPKSFVYSRAAEHEYWDGYNGNFVTLFDDFGQMKDVSGSPDNEFMNLIRCTNVFSYLCHMAAIEQKGSVAFNSKIIIATTNLVTFRPQSIVEPEALSRRFHLDVVMMPKKEYRIDEVNGTWGYRLDKSKVDASQPIDPNIYEFVSKDGIIYSYEEFIQKCIEVFRKLQRQHEIADQESADRMDIGFNRRFGFKPQMQFEEMFFDAVESIEGTRTKLSSLDYATVEAAVSNVKNCFKGWLIQFWDKIKDYRGVRFFINLFHRVNAVDAATLLILGMLIKGCYNSLFSSTKGESKSVEDTPTDCSPQAVTELAVENIIKKLYDKSCYSVSAPGHATCGTGFFLKEDIFIMPYHFVKAFGLWHLDDGSFKIRLYNKSSKEEIFLDSSDVLSNCKFYYDKDIAVYQVKSMKSSMKPDISSLFVPEHVIKVREKLNAHLVTLNKTLPLVHDVQVRRTESHVYGSTKLGFFKLDYGLHYKFPVGPGCCGNLLILRDTTARHTRILGFHVSGNSTGDAFSNVLTQEFLKNVVSELSGSNVEPQLGDAKFETFKFVKKLDRPVGSARNTAFSRSPLHGAWGPAKKAPAKLYKFNDKDGIRQDPMRIGLKDYDVKRPDLPQDLVDACLEATFNSFYKKSGENVEDRLGLLTFEQAVLGVPGVKYLESIPRKTSAGYPDNMYRIQDLKGKEMYFGTGMDYDLDNPRAVKLKEECLEILENCRKGIRPDFYNTVCLKDELRPLEKVYSGNSRIFSGHPLRSTIVFRMLFGDWGRMMSQAGLKIGIGSFVNPYSAEWSHLHRQLKRLGPYGIDGDYKGFDKSHRAQVLKGFVKFINWWYNDSPENQLAREILWKDVWNSKNIIGDTIYEWFQSLPSGHPFTTLINNIYNHFNFKLAWVYAHDKDVLSLHKYDEHVELVTGGDDNAANLSPYAQEVFNQIKLTEIFAEMQLVYTSADKSKANEPYRLIDDLTFLKRGFRFEEAAGRVVAPLAMDSILEMPYWTKKGPLYHVIPETNVTTALYELSLHGKEVYEEWADRILRKTLDLIQFVPTFTHWPIVFRETLTWDSDYTMKPQPGMAYKLHDVVNTSYSYARSVISVKDSGAPPDLVPIDTLEGIIEDPYQCQCAMHPSPLSGTVADRVSEEKINWCKILTVQCGNSSQSQALIAYYPRNDLNSPGTTNAVDVILANSRQKTRSAEINNDKSGANVVMRAEEMGSTTVGSSITTFNNQANVVVSKPEAHVDLDKIFRDDPMRNASQDIMNFLSRPQMIQSVLWSTQGQNAEMFACTIPGNFVLPTSAIPVPNWIDKLKGFRGFRGKCVVTLQVNGNKFQQGRLMLTFMPNTDLQMYSGMRVRSVMSSTMLPHVELDVSCDTEATLEIPWISPFAYYDLTQDKNQLGKITLRVYSPLKYGSGSSSAEISVWMHWENIELAAPTVPQMGRKASTKRSFSEEEEIKNVGGPVSTALVHVSGAANALSSIPLLSSFMRPAAWVTNALAGAAASFGFSKPVTTVASQRMTNAPNAYANNYNGTDMSFSMGLAADNAVTMLPGFSGTNIDEMSMNFFVSVPAYFWEVNWSSSQPPGTLLWTHILSPMKFVKQVTASVTGGTVTYYDMTPMAFMAHHFQYWRGSFVIKMKIVKTSFHSGRLVLTMNNMNPAVTSTAMDLNSSSWLNREVIDVREGNEYTFLFPYSALTPWLSTGSIGQNIDGEAFGVLQLMVLNTLVAPATVSDNIDMLFEVRGHTDVEFACPRFYKNMEPTMLEFGPQMGDECAVVAKTIGNSTPDRSSMQFTEFCIGESITSLRQLLKRMYYCFTAYANFTMRPFALTAGSHDYNDAAFNGDLISTFGLCYAYNRGSMLVKVMPSQDSTALPNAPLNAVLQTNATIVAPFDYSVSETDLGTHRNMSYVLNQNPSHNSLELKIPNYQQTYTRINNPVITGTSDLNSRATSKIALSVRGPTNTNQVDVFRAIGDDFSFGFFLGTPPMYVSSV